MTDFLEELAQASNPAAIYGSLARRVWDHLPTSSVHVMPLAPCVSGNHASVLYHRRDIVDELLAIVGQSVQALQAEPGLPNLFATPQRTLRVEAALGWSRWLRTPVYQEFFRRAESAQQLVVGIVDRERVPRAFLAVCRSESDDLITSEEQAQVLRVRDQAERALAAFDLAADWSLPADDILAGLSAALPLPALLMSAKRILWMNHEAKLRFGMASLSFGSNTFYVGQSPALADLMVRVQLELARPGSTLATTAAPREHEWLLPGESIIVRRLSGNDNPACCLVCLDSASPPCARPPLEDLKRMHPLTSREADITRLAIEGYSVLSIASRLNIAESTVCTHLKRIYKKLGVRSRAELAWRIAGTP